MLVVMQMTLSELVHNFNQHICDSNQANKVFPLFTGLVFMDGTLIVIPDHFSGAITRVPVPWT